MTAQTCLLANRPRVSGHLWHFPGGQEGIFGETGQGVGGITVGTDRKLLELMVAGGEKILGTRFSEENKAALWTEAGNIFILTFTANHYWRLGKPGLVNCLQFVTGTVNIAVGLRTKKALIIDTESGAIRRRFSETEEIKEVEGRGEVVFVLTSRHLSLFSHKTEQIIHR